MGGLVSDSELTDATLRKSGAFMSGFIPFVLSPRIASALLIIHLSAALCQCYCDTMNPSSHLIFLCKAENFVILYLS